MHIYAAHRDHCVKITVDDVVGFQKRLAQGACMDEFAFYLPAMSLQKRIDVPSVKLIHDFIYDQHDSVRGPDKFPQPRIQDTAADLHAFRYCKRIDGHPLLRSGSYFPGAFPAIKELE